MASNASGDWKSLIACSIRARWASRATPALVMPDKESGPKHSFAMRMLVSSLRLFTSATETDEYWWRWWWWMMMREKVCQWCDLVPSSSKSSSMACASARATNTSNPQTRIQRKTRGIFLKKKTRRFQVNNKYLSTSRRRRTPRRTPTRRTAIVSFLRAGILSRWTFCIRRVYICVYRSRENSWKQLVSSFAH